MATALQVVLWLGALLPRVDDPWPERVDVTLPLTFAGAGSVIGGYAFPGATAVQRERWAAWLGSIGLYLGIVVYGLLFAYQLLSKS